VLRDVRADKTCSSSEKDLHAIGGKASARTVILREAGPDRFQHAEMPAKGMTFP
jgi:hypothetical protein